MSRHQQFRPRRATPKPFVQGPQTAMVVGPAGDEIYTDKFGRVKVQFHWDRYGGKDQNSSCWIRVSHPWAGKGWGSVATPRIGQEVIVEFLEGDPDQPIITGRVYNAENQPPFGFPAGAVLSGIKSNTHKGAGYNELSMDDTAGKERITIHGQYDMNSTIEHDQTLTVHNNRTDKIDVDDSETVGKNQSLKVGVNRTKTIGANETISVRGNRTSTVSKSETATVALQRTHTVGINETISVGSAQEISVGAAQVITVGLNRLTNVGKDDSTRVGKNYLIDADDSVTIKTGDASITMKKDGTITIKGKDIRLDGSGMINVKASKDVVVKGSKVGVN
jgi:type VI secretion system secreted protein VgrG